MTPKVFLVSGSDIDTVTATTEKLGRARVQSSGEYESSVTHYVTQKVTRSEKLLCCTAGGKWVLHPDYIKDSEKVSFSFYLRWVGLLCFITDSSLYRPATGCQSRTTSGGTKRTTSSSPRRSRSSNWPLPLGSGGWRREDRSRGLSSL